MNKWDRDNSHWMEKKIREEPIPLNQNPGSHCEKKSSNNGSCREKFFHGVNLKTIEVRITGVK